ncbi:LysM peptidoglycan-binding domain-containing protein [Effusibacillus lacus]|uniref:LysM domain-containing protein n=1 Tax=Effusibacillus lacus TaxID=1348429 RepID=A0A292YN16_9BACL|nr:M23 family metallopeptidase [Effusibacillus lacus]TCS68172.1 murein DD-endopeptidase MepM/ murein hydrolase activator NlpD [Effusibacillus lacus]GAX90301.1 hypothetical protein EFBL_1927 [Effusibacillus lacus]
MKKALLLAAVASLMLGASPALAYTVQPGDSLWKIAQANHVTVNDLMKANNLTTDTIYPGQTLVIPGKSITYTVVRGDSLWKIANKYNTTTNAIVKLNNLKTYEIYPGQQLKIPVSVGRPSVQKPAAFADGMFPLAKGTYKPFANTYRDGRSWNPDGSGSRPHEGVDIMADKGTPIYSVMDGTIVQYGWNQYGGYRLTIRVNDSTVFYYAHLSKYAEGLSKGSAVKKGQLIGYVGSTGYGPEGTEGKFDSHLHFGVYKTSPSWTPVDPYPYLKWWESQR